MFVPLSTIRQVKISVRQAKEAVNVDSLVPDLVRINQCRTLVVNVEPLQASDCTMTEAYELLKNMHFLDDPSSIPAYTKKKTTIHFLFSNSNKLYQPGAAPTTYALLQKAQPIFAAVERSYSMLSKLLKKKELLMLEMSKNTCFCITINHSGNCIA